MVQYNYQWRIKKQKRVLKKRLFFYLRNTISKYSPFYREWFKKHEIDVNDLFTFEDFQRIPPTTKELHLQNPKRFILQPYQPGWWESTFQTESLPRKTTFKYWLKSLHKTYLREVFSTERITEEERIIMEAVNDWLPALFLSTSSAQKPALIAYTKYDLEKIVPELIGTLFLSGFRPNWEIYNILSPEPTIAYFQNVWSPTTIGGGSYFACDEEDTPLQKQLQIASDITFETFVGTPSLTKLWLEYAHKQIENSEITPISSFKLCILTGETMNEKVKKEIKTLFQKIGSEPKILESYANNRARAVFYECSEDSGIHLNPRYFYWEVLDQKTLEPVGEGEKGLLAFSHIGWHGTAFIRYLTGDLVEGLTWEKCPSCDLVVPKIKGPIKRLEKKQLNKKK